MAKSSNPQKIPRPMNCFLAFRLEKQNEIIARCPGANHRDISKIIAKWWKETPEEEKAVYRERARQAKLEHSELYPDYKYKPQKKNGRRTRKYARRPQNKFTSRKEENNRIMEILYSGRDIDSCQPLQTAENDKDVFAKCEAESLLPSNDLLPTTQDALYPLAPATTLSYPSTTFSPFSSTEGDFLSTCQSSPHMLHFANDPYTVSYTSSFCDTVHPDTFNVQNCGMESNEFSFQPTTFFQPEQQYVKEELLTPPTSIEHDPVSSLLLDPAAAIDPHLLFYNTCLFLTPLAMDESMIYCAPHQPSTAPMHFYDVPNLGYPTQDMTNNSCC